MLNELVLKQKKNEETHEYRFEHDVEKLIVLGENLGNHNEVFYDYRGKTVKVRGIPENFVIYLDNELVCEIALGNAYRVNKKLVTELLS